MGTYNLANKHPRVNILPGTGVGGHCIAVDPWFIVSAFEKEANIIRNAREINTFETVWVVEKIKNSILAFELENKVMPKVALMGLAFKANIDDLKVTAVLVAETLLHEKIFDIILVEPNLDQHPQFDLVNYNLAIDRSDIIVYLVAHKQFQGLVTNSLELDFCGIKKY